MILTGKFVQLEGTVDGVNKVFTTPSNEAYQAGSTMVLLRGIPRDVSDGDDGWTESDPGTGEVTLNVAPISGDNIFLHYTVEVSGAIEVEITPVDAVLTPLQRFSGIIEDGELDGNLDESELVATPIETEEAVDGQVVEIIELSGKIICDV